jgi:flagellar transcriptional activator FlhD
MTSEQILAEIREANLTYLMLAQSLIRADKPQALFRLGLSEESADLIGGLSPAQVMKIAAGSMLLCRFRADDDMVWSLLTQHNLQGRTVNDATSRLHAGIVMAGRFAESTPS